MAIPFGREKQEAQRKVLKISLMQQRKKGLHFRVIPYFLLAGPMGLEPTASGVTGRRYNQLNYDPVWRYLYSDEPCLSSKLAGPMGLEPTASGVTGRRYNQLNYDPL